MSDYERFRDVAGKTMGDIPKGLTRTSFTVVVDDAATWTVETLLSAVWDGRTDTVKDPLSIYVARNSIAG